MNKKTGYLITAFFLLVLTLITLFLIFLFMHPTVYFSKASGFSQHDGVKAGKNKLRFVVPETVDTTKSTYISVKQEWFETSRMGRITDIKAKPGKYLALDFTDRHYDSEVFTIYTKNWFGIKREHDVIVDYSNFLRVFFPEPHAGEAPRKPIILPYSKLKTEYKHIYEELLKIKNFVAFDEKGLASGQSVPKDEVFNKESARGRAFIVNNNTHVSLVYDFLLPGIFKDQNQKTQVIDYIEKSVGKFKTYDPEKQGIDIKFNTAPFYIFKFLGWHYIDPTGNRVDLAPGQEILIPKWVMSELRLIARYDITTDTDKIGPELDKQGLVAVSYFNGAQRVIFDIVKKGTPLKEHIYKKEGYAYAGWYKDSALTEKVDFTKELATTHTVLYLKSIKQNQPQPEKPVQYHTINFITPSDANQLFPTRRAHGQKLETNYLTPSLVSRLDANGNLEELDYWNLVDPVTGARTRFEFSTPITEDITLEAVMRKRVVPNSKYTIKRYFESVDQAGNFIEDKSKEEVVEGQTPGTEVELSPTQTNAPTGFTLASGTVVKKKINKDGTTVFELRYTRNRYTVDFEVNYNGNHFKGVNSSTTPSQTVAYEGKLTKPANPTITKAGYTYVFKHWQLKDEMGNVYKEGTAFDFGNTKITKNLTLVAYFEEKKYTATYTIKHIFQGITGQIDERLEEKKFTEQVGKSITISQENRDKAYDQHYEVADFIETKKVEADGSTVFEIRYARKKYKVNFEINYNGNHFAGATASTEAAQTVPYEGRVKKPEYNPSLTKPGYTYTFVQWQLKSNMNGEYVKTQAYDFSQPVTGDVDLVAYFKEEKTTSTFQIKHVIEGVDDIQEETRVVTKTAKVGSTFTVTSEHRLPEYDAHFTIDGLNQTKEISADGTTVFTLNYVRKSYNVTYEVNYNGNHFSDVAVGNQPQSTQVKYQGKITKPAQNPTLTKEGYNYQFVHWQEKTAMNGAYSQIAEFDFNNKQITGNTSLVAYFTEKPNRVNYTIKHLFKGIAGEIEDKVKETTNTALTDSSHNLTDSDLHPDFNPNGFTAHYLKDSKKINGNGSTVFEITYERKEFTVNFVVWNYIKVLKPKGYVSPDPVSLKVKFQGKITKPAETPEALSLGRTYEFIHWQDFSLTNGTYSEVQGFDFSNESASKDLTLVAYFKETIHRVNYKIVHYLEKQGKDENLNDQFDIITIEKKNQKVEDGAHYEEYAELDTNLYEKDKRPNSSVLKLQLHKGNNNSFVFQNYLLKTIIVNYNKTEGVQSFSHGGKLIRKTRKITFPEVTLKSGYDFVGWAISLNSQPESEYIARDSNLTFYALTRQKYTNVIYQVSTEDKNGKLNLETFKKRVLVGSIHVVDYDNPDSNVYKMTYNLTKLTAHVDENQNLVKVTLKRHIYTVSISHYGYYDYIAQDVINVRHGASIDDRFLELSARRKYKEFSVTLNGNTVSDYEIQIRPIIRNSEIEITAYLKKFYYPQKEVSNPSYHTSILTKSNIRYKYERLDKDFTIERTRYYSKSGLAYEKYNGKFYLLEEIEMMKLPNSDLSITKKIIDFSPINLISGINSKDIKDSILYGLVKNISELTSQDFHLPEYSDSGYGVKHLYQNHVYKDQYFKKEPTDYAKAILNSEDYGYRRNYRKISFSDPVIDIASFYFRYLDHSNTYKYWTSTANNGTYFYSFFGEENYTINHLLGVVLLT